MTACWRRDASGAVRLEVRVTPGAGSDVVGGVHAGAGGAVRLAMRVSAPPEDGRANAAVLSVISEALGVAKSSLLLASGEKGRHKTIVISGDATALGARIDALAALEPQGGRKRK